MGIGPIEEEADIYIIDKSEKMTRNYIISLLKYKNIKRKTRRKVGTSFTESPTLVNSNSQIELGYLKVCCCCIQLLNRVLIFE